MAGLAHSQQAQRPDGEPAADEATSAIDKMVAREIDSFTAINDKIVAQVMIKSNHSSTCQFNSHPPTRIFVCVGQGLRVLQGHNNSTCTISGSTTSSRCLCTTRSTSPRWAERRWRPPTSSPSLLRRWQVHAGGEVYGSGVPAADRQAVHNNWKYLCLRPTEEAIIARATC